MSGWRLALGGLAVAGLLAGGLWLARPHPPPPRTVVLVVLDTVRADHLPTGGAPADRAPWLANLARSSVVFHNAFSTSSCTAPATASMFTGLYPPQHGVTEGFRAQQRAAGAPVELDDPDIELRSMPRDLPTLPERFRAAGWHTVGVANNLNIGPEMGFDRGFDQFRSDREADGEDLGRTLVEWMREAADSTPTFEYIHLNDAHHPYQRRAAYYQKPADRRLDGMARYDSEIRYLDQVLADLAAGLHWDDSTAIVVVSDHGEAFGEHGDNGHIFSLFGEVNRIGMLVHAPRQIPGGVVVDTNASLIDLLPTLLDLAGLPPSEGPGRSLLPLARGDATGFVDRVLFAQRKSPRQPTTLWAAIQGRWKLIDDEGLGPSYRLYDLADDRPEDHDLHEAEPARVGALARPLDAFRQLPARTDGPDVAVPVDDQLYDQLEQLGYVQ